MYSSTNKHFKIIYSTYITTTVFYIFISDNFVIKDSLGLSSVCWKLYLHLLVPTHHHFSNLFLLLQNIICVYNGYYFFKFYAVNIQILQSLYIRLYMTAYFFSLHGTRVSPFSRNRLSNHAVFFTYTN